MKKPFSKVLGVSLGLLLLASPVSAFADTKSQLVSKKQDLSQQTSQLVQEVTQNKDKIHTLTGKITTTQIKVGETQAQIKQLDQKMTDTKDRIKKRTEILKDQVRTTYVEGSNQSMLDVLLSSSNFGDLVSRAYAVYKITNHQQQLINQQVADEKALKDEQTQVKQKNQEAQDSLGQLKQYVSDLQNTIQTQQNKIAQLKSEGSNVDNQLASLIHTSAMSLPARNSGTPNSGSTPSASAPTSGNSNTSNSASAPVAVTIPTAAASGSVSDLIHNASRYFGNSVYVFGGGRTASDIANGRFDCSGFVHWAFDSIGINLGGWTTSSLQYVGTPVSPSNMQPGDLVFFNTYEPNGHVGIYIGNGEFIGSQDSTGVAIASMHNVYWAAHFSGTVRRVLN